MTTVARIAVWQCSAGMVAAAMWLLMEGWHAAVPALCGAGIAAALTLYAGIRTFGTASADPRQKLRSFYSAQARKFLLAAVLFAGAVQVFGRDFLPLITTFAAALMVYGMALLWNPGDGS